MIVSNFPTASRVYTDQVTSLAASVVANNPSSLSVTWVKPTSKKFVGTVIVYKEGSYPTSPSDGTQAYYGSGSSCTITGLSGGTTYYIRAYAKASNTSGTKIYYNTSDIGAQVAKATVCTPVVLSMGTRTSSSLTVNWGATTDPSRTIRILRKTGSYPTNDTDGTQIYDASNTAAGSVVDSGLSSLTTYYYRAFVYNQYGVANSNASQQLVATTKVAAGQVIFTSSQLWTVPAGVTVADMFGVGGGSGGNAGYPSGGGGGGGRTTTKLAQVVTPGQQISAVVGAGGVGGIFNGSVNYGVGGAGSASSFGAFLTAAGGSVGISSLDGCNDGNAGGSGGGGAGSDNTYPPIVTGGIGGSNGSNGASGYTGYPGIGGAGQGTTTKAFAETGNTLYSGGGGGAGNDGVGASGGSGGGGIGGDYRVPTVATSGTANTGGGGGGGLNMAVASAYGGNGGSGIIIVRWPEQ